MNCADYLPLPALHWGQVYLHRRPLAQVLHGAFLLLDQLLSNPLCLAEYLDGLELDRADVLSQLCLDGSRVGDSGTDDEFLQGHQPRKDVSVHNFFGLNLAEPLEYALHVVVALTPNLEVVHELDYSALQGDLFVLPQWDAIDVLLAPHTTRFASRRRLQLA